MSTLDMSTQQAQSEQQQQQQQQMQQQPQAVQQQTQAMQSQQQQQQQQQSQQQQPQQQQIDGQSTQDAQQTFMQINNWDPNRQVQVIPTGISNTGYMQYATAPQGQVMMPNLTTFPQPNGPLVLSPAGAKQFQPNQITAAPQTVYITQGNKLMQAPASFQGFNQLPMTSNGHQTFVLASGNISNIMQQQTGNSVPAMNQQDSQKDLQPMMQQWQVQSMPQQVWSSPQPAMFAQSNITYVNRAGCNQQGEIFTTSGVVQNNQNLIAQVVNTQNNMKRPLDHNSQSRPIVARNILPNQQTMRPATVATSQATPIQNVLLLRAPQQVKTRPKTFVGGTTTIKQKPDQMVSQLTSQAAPQQVSQQSIVNTQPMVTAMPQPMIQQQVMIRSVQPQQQAIGTPEMMNMQPTMVSIPQPQTGIVNAQAPIQQQLQQVQPQPFIISQVTTQGTEMTSTTTSQPVNSVSTEDKTSTKALAMVKPHQMVTHVINGRTIKEVVNTSESVDSSLPNSIPDLNGSDPKSASVQRNSDKSPNKKRKLNGIGTPNETCNGSASFSQITLDGDLAKTDPQSWTIPEVAKFVKTLPHGAELAEKFESEEIDGEALFMLEPEHLMYAMEMKLGPALKMIEQIKAIRGENATDSSSSDSSFLKPSGDKMKT